MRLNRWSWATAALSTVLCLSSVAHAQDAGGGSDASAPSDGGAGGPTTITTCPTAVSTLSAPVSFSRMGPVRFGPGTGMSMVGSRSGVGLEYNLLFSGTYRASMRGQIRARWPRAITLSAVGDPMGGSLQVEFGLRMTARIYVLGVGIDVPLTTIIDDMVDRGSSTFDPWAWNYENTDVRLNASAWRTIYTYTVNVAGDDYPIELSVRYNMTTSIRTVEIGFPRRADPAEMMLLGAITREMQEVVIPAPLEGALTLPVRWRSELRYQGGLEFRVRVLRRTCIAGICTNVSFMAPEFTVALSEQQLPDPYDQIPPPRFPVPIANIAQTEVDFGAVMLNTSFERTIDVANPGAGELGVQVSTPTEMAFRLGSPGGCVAPGGMRRIPVTFTPTREGMYRTTVRVDSNGVSGAPTEVTLIGRGTTGPSVPPRPSDGGVSGDGGVLADGGRRVGEYNGALQDAGCACRTPAGNPARNAPRGALAALGALALVLAARRRRE